jgi:ubiquinone/menaquinone biosynthesis C-methylase UbiE
VLPEDLTKEALDCMAQEPKHVRNVGAQTESGWTPRVQVSEEHYSAQYDDWDTWIRYYWQIRSVMERGLREVLEIGVGSGVVTSYLRRNGVRVTTLDIDPALHPDCVASVTAIPFPSARFDGVLCTEVLEHMPFERSCQAIAEISRVARSWALVTVPHFTLSFALLLRAPILHLREIRVRVPYPKRIRPSDIGQHFWECGKRGFPVARLRRAFRGAGFRIVSEQRPFTNYSSCFFLMEKEDLRLSHEQPPVRPKPEA